MRNRRELSIIIPAAGTGRRMKSYGPKPMIDLPGGETVLGRQIRVLRTVFPKSDLVVVVGYEADRVMRSLPPGVRAVENESYETTGVARSLGMGLRVALHRRILIVYGDLVFTAPAVSWAASAGPSVLLDSHGQMDSEEIGATVVGGFVTSFNYGLPAKWGQVALLAGRELDLFKRFVWSEDTRRHFGFEALNSVIDAGGRIRAVEPAGVRIVEIDAPRDIERAREIVS
jgi:CTP:molybdopterin cytidylyltransferase MocA